MWKKYLLCPQYYLYAETAYLPFHIFPMVKYTVYFNTTKVYLLLFVQLKIVLQFISLTELLFILYLPSILFLLRYNISYD